MNNLNFTIKQGEVGKQLEFTLSDDNGTFDLTGYAVTLTARRGISDPVLDAVAVVPDEDQTANRGKCVYTFDADSAAIAVGPYDAELKVVNADRTLYWPVSRDNTRTYFKINVQRHL